MFKTILIAAAITATLASAALHGNRHYSPVKPKAQACCSCCAYCKDNSCCDAKCKAGSCCDQCSCCSAGCCGKS